MSKCAVCDEKEADITCATCNRVMCVECDDLVHNVMDRPHDRTSLHQATTNRAVDHASIDALASMEAPSVPDAQRRQTLPADYEDDDFNDFTGDVVAVSSSAAGGGAAGFPAAVNAPPESQRAALADVPPPGLSLSVLQEARAHAAANGSLPQDQSSAPSVAPPLVTTETARQYLPPPPPSQDLPAPAVTGAAPVASAVAPPQQYVPPLAAVAPTGHVGSELGRMNVQELLEHTRRQLAQRSTPSSAPQGAVPPPSYPVGLGVTPARPHAQSRLSGTALLPRTPGTASQLGGSGASVGAGASTGYDPNRASAVLASATALLEQTSSALKARQAGAGSGYNTSVGAGVDGFPPHYAASLGTPLVGAGAGDGGYSGGAQSAAPMPSASPMMQGSVASGVGSQSWHDDRKAQINALLIRAGLPPLQERPGSGSYSRPASTAAPTPAASIRPGSGGTPAYNSALAMAASIQARSHTGAGAGAGGVVHGARTPMLSAMTPLETSPSSILDLQARSRDIIDKAQQHQRGLDLVSRVTAPPKPPSSVRSVPRSPPLAMPKPPEDRLAEEANKAAFAEAQARAELQAAEAAAHAGELAAEAEAKKNGNRAISVGEAAGEAEAVAEAAPDSAAGAGGVTDGADETGTGSGDAKAEVAIEDLANIPKSELTSEQEAVLKSLKGRAKHGQEVNQGHAMFSFTAMTVHGIRMSVERSNKAALSTALGVGGKAEGQPLKEEFSHFTKDTFDMESKAWKAFKFKDYAPEAFHLIRRMFGVDSQQYLNSICGTEPWSQLGTPGKSGQLFYFSADGRYLIKTITKAECKVLRAILPAYYDHCKKYPNTLLCRFFGMHRLKPQNLHIVVMMTVLDTDRVIHERYDLKGSKQGREATPEQKRQSNVILKDNDLTAMQRKLRMGPDRKKSMMAQMEADAGLLSSLGIMDYSLLLGIHYRDRPRPEGQANTVRSPASAPDTRRRRGSLAFKESTYVSTFQNDAGGVASLAPDGTPTGNEIYFFGIIDILQRYNVSKQVETGWKGIWHNKNEISSVSPEFYARRFLKYMSNITE